MYVFLTISEMKQKRHFLIFLILFVRKKELLHSRRFYFLSLKSTVKTMST